jgi:hypothetical protein
MRRRTRAGIEQRLTTTVPGRIASSVFVNADLGERVADPVDQIHRYPQTIPPRWPDHPVATHLSAIPLLPASLT